MCYLDLCNALITFANENDLTVAELCAFVYDYEMSQIREELAQEQQCNHLPEPAQAWFMVGSYTEGEKAMENGFWQGSPETKKGDILVFYEKAPAKSINSIWRAYADGVVDSFYLYYSNTYMGDKKPLPPITLDELKADEYFCNHPLVRKQFQGGSGWPLNSEDYANLRRLWSARGVDVSSLPALMAHEFPKDIDFSEKEASVHKHLVLALLAKMGWTEANGDLLNQVNLHVGHGETGKIGRTDVSLHPYGEDLKKARVLIEEKYWMKNESEIQETFRQGVSYANLQNAGKLVLCDRSQIVVFARDKNNEFDVNSRQTFYWDEMANADKFNMLKKLLS